MLKKIYNLSIRKKLWAIILVGIIGILLAVGYSAATLKENLLEDRKAKTRHLVESAHSLVTHYQQAAVSGKLTVTAAKTAAAEAIKALRYDQKGYFWINDFTPRVIMHPIKPEIIGKDMGQVTDGNGKYHWQAFVELARRDGGGFVDYVFLHKSKGLVAPKLSYVKAFKPWGWVIGTGIYIDDIDEIYHRQLVGQLLLMSGSLLIMLLVSVWIGHTIATPVQRLSEVIQGVESDGLLNDRSGFQHEDEIGCTGQAFDRMLEGLAVFVREIQQVSQQMLGKADQLSAISDKTSAGMHRQQQETQQAATATTQMAASANEISNSAGNAANSTSNANGKAREGSSMLHDTIDTMQTMNEHMQHVSNLVNHLESETTRIGSVLNVIRGIAEQTNLLALNAAIEAARAGDMGRGFAVVADEVRTLAQRTQASTTEIDEMISNLQTATNDLVSAMQKGVEATDRGMEHAAVTDDSLLVIVNAIEQIEAMNQQVATAAEEQSVVSSEINGNITNINEGALSITALTAEMSEISQQTRDAAQRMQAVAARYQS
ncbi:MAG: methyl-accepting chemotaxis protein [Gammaproteobacteria bacterium]|nr:methyl-accepting chemotaxis protein [Gammaproteobacteria bacterium]